MISWNTPLPFFISIGSLFRKLLLKMQEVVQTNLHINHFIWSWRASAQITTIFMHFLLIVDGEVWIPRFLFKLQHYIGCPKLRGIFLKVLNWIWLYFFLFPFLFLLILIFKVTIMKLDLTWLRPAMCYLVKVRERKQKEET